MTLKTKGWQNRLVDYLSSIGPRPFEFGKFDCGVMAGRAVGAMTGHNPYAVLEGKYRTLAGGFRLAKKLGVASHVEYMMRNYPKLPSPLHCLPGDLVAVPAQNWSGETLGIVQGALIYVPAAIGITTVPLEMATSACRI